MESADLLTNDFRAELQSPSRGCRCREHGVKQYRDFAWSIEVTSRVDIKFPHKEKDYLDRSNMLVFRNVRPGARIKGHESHE